MKKFKKNELQDQKQDQEQDKKIKTLVKQGFIHYMVTGTGFGPVNACVKGICVKPLHQPAVL